MLLNFTSSNIDILKSSMKIGSNYVYTSDLLMENKLFLHSNLEILKFNKFINWDYTHKSSSKTYQVYIHSLSFFNSLLYRYEKTNDEKFYEKADLLLDDWLFYLDNTNNKFIWTEHSISKRIITLLYFLTFKKTITNNYKKIEKLIINYIEFLANPNNYKENNHGLMMDKSLLIASVFLNDEEQSRNYLHLVKNRVEKLIYRDFSYKGIHLENSPEYHLLVFNLLKDIKCLFKSLDLNLDLRAINILEKSKYYLSYIINSNNELPMIGDTSFKEMNIKKSYDDLIDYEAGISVFNNELSKSTLIFNSGFKSRVHKHRDDLSFLYSLNGENLFIDAGKYSYDYDNNLVNFIRSPLAHNTFTITNFAYSISDYTLANLKNVITTSNYKYALGEIKTENVSLQRHLILFDNDCIAILDRGISNKSEEWVQNFLLETNVSVDRHNKHSLKLNTAKKEFLLKFINSSTKNHTLFGIENNAFVSKKFNQYINTYRIENKAKGTNCELLTLIVPKHKNNFEVKVQNSNIILKRPSKKIITIEIQ